VTKHSLWQILEASEEAKDSTSLM